MPLFVPILRLLLLFLNVYDSYKTLKTPPPSSRNAGRPSVRAMSQRKRDMKGSLAVWIVWVALSMYERVLESVICLLIPFYNEFKSLALLFLILTRARGAEPIYLHLIRPLVKPYTSTLDGALDIMLMIGDFVFALSMYPIHLGLEWWQRLHAGKSDGFVTGQENSTSEYSSEADISDAPSSLLEFSVAPTSSKNSKRRSSESRRQSGGEVGAGDTVDSASGSTHGAVPKVQTVTNRSIVGSSRPSKSSLQRNSTFQSRNPVLDMEPNLFQPLKSETASQHQIWYPPKTSSSDVEEEVRQAALLRQEQQKLDEWRQYPPFPAAYPPTPLAVTATLVKTPLTSYPAIEEEQLRQDFCPSLLPQREPLNPSPAVDMSDLTINTSIGNSPWPVGGVSSDDSMDEEDQFNITLGTPLPVMGKFRAHLYPPSPLSTASSAASVGSRPSALTTTDVGSPLKTHETVSDSSSGRNLADSIPIIGNKRAFPRGDLYTVTNRVHQVEEGEPFDTSDADSAPILSTLKTQNDKSSNSFISRSGGALGSSDVVDDGPGTSSSGSKGGVKENIRCPAPPEEKRRKVIRSSTITRVPAVPARTRTGKDTSSQSSSQQTREFLEAPRPSMRLSTRTLGAPFKDIGKRKQGDHPFASSSGLAEEMAPPVIPQKRNLRIVSGKR